MTATHGPRDLARPPSVLLVGGSAGGVDICQEASLTAFLRALGGVEVTAVARDPRRLIERHAVPAFSPTALPALAKKMAAASALVFAGGPLLGARRRRSGKPTLGHLQAALALAAYAHAVNTTVLGVGLSSADLTAPGARALAREFARRADLLVLRDDESAHRLVDAGASAPLRVGADPVWTLTDEWVRPATTAAAVVFVLDELDPPSAAGVAALGRLARRLTSEGLGVRIDRWSREPAASAVADRVARAGGPVELADPPVDLAHAAARLAGARLVVTTRLHGQIAAAVMGVPCLSLQRETGQAALAARLGQFSCPLPEAAAGGEFAGAEAALAAAALRALAGAGAAESAVKAELAAAHAGFDLMRLMLGVSDVPAARIDGLRLEAGVR